MKSAKCFMVLTDQSIITSFSNKCVYRWV